jgi:plastocyanin
MNQQLGVACESSARKLLTPSVGIIDLVAMKKRIIWMALVAGILVAPALFADEVIDATGWDDEVKEIEVRSEGLVFTPSEIRVNRGDTVRITYVNTRGTHDWTLDEFDVATARIPAGQSETVEFVADQAGEFEFYCSVPGHRAAGMYGRFVVVD